MRSFFSTNIRFDKIVATISTGGVISGDPISVNNFRNKIEIIFRVTHSTGVQDDRKWKVQIPRKKIPKNWRILSIRIDGYRYDPEKGISPTNVSINRVGTFTVLPN